MHQASLNSYFRQNPVNSFKGGFMPVTGYAGYLQPKVLQIDQIFFYFLVAFRIRKTEQLGITNSVILVANNTEPFEVSGIHPQMNVVVMNDGG